MAKSSASKKSKQGGKAKSGLISFRKNAEGARGKAFEAQLKKLKAENDALRKAAAATAKENEMMIPRPPSGSGVAGNGFNLQTAMRLEDNTNLYTALRRCVRELTAAAGVDCSVTWHRQPKLVIARIVAMARERHHYFKRFPHGWAVEEFIKSSLKNKRAYARKRGYFAELTNLDDVASDKDEDKEDEEDREDEEDEEDKEDEDAEDKEDEGDKDKGVEVDWGSSDLDIEDL